MSVLDLRSPLSGWCMPLAEVPDPVFAGGMMGDGVAIDPTDGVLSAPCDGELISVAPSKHAVTMRASNGAELLLHVGIDTVALNGTGFETLVQPGQHVRVGDSLLRFDLDRVARLAPSLVTPMIVTNSTEFQITRRVQGLAVLAGDSVMELRRLDAASAGVSDRAVGGAGAAAQLSLRVSLEHGLHARPAALVVRTAREFDADVHLRAHGRQASARSAVALMSLGVRRNDAIDIEAEGPDAERVVAALEMILRGHSAPESPATNAPPTTGPPGVCVPTVLLPGAELAGVVASPGFAVGQAFRIVRRERDVEEHGHGLTHETLELNRARGEVRTHLRVLAGRVEGPQHEIAAAHLEFLDDPGLDAAAAGWIAQGKSAAYAWRRAVRASIDALRALGDARLAERVDDLLDLESQVLGALAGEKPAAALALPGQAILIANDLLPSQIATLAPGAIAGICIARGGATSHVAILAAAMRIPALVSMGSRVLAIDDGTQLLLDAEAGLLRVDPPASVLVEVEQTIRERRVREVTERAAALDDCVTADGVRIGVFANIATAADARDAVQLGAEGCGLLRTEFLFLDRQIAPGVDEQTREYQRIIDAFAHRPVVIRTLDVGGDKPIPYLQMPHEDNPALGLRGVRTSLLYPDLLRAQLQAILAVRPIASCRVMLPMISNTDEVRRVRTLLDEVAVRAGSRATLPLGVMIETPAAALIADQICDVADFVSIGTNDLTQYTLAMDRTQPELAGQVDGLHPAVLRLIARAAEAAHARARPVAVCGGLASDALAVPVLIGLGVHELSAVPAFIPRLKAILRSCTIEECRELARRALELDSAASVRAMMRRRFGATTDQRNEQVSA